MFDRNSRHDVGEAGSGSVQMLAIVCGCLCLTTALVPVVGVYATRQRAQVATDQAALIAADAASGLLDADPCVVAREALVDVRITAWSCHIASDDAFVQASIRFGPFDLDVRSRAGRPRSS